MKGKFFKGDVKDVCAELKKELERYGKISVGKWLSLRKIEIDEAKQFGISADEFRKNIKKN